MNEKEKRLRNMLEQIYQAEGYSENYWRIKRELNLFIKPTDSNGGKHGQVSPFPVIPDNERK